MTLVLRPGQRARGGDIQAVTHNLLVVTARQLSASTRLPVGPAIIIDDDDRQSPAPQARPTAPAFTVRRGGRGPVQWRLPASGRRSVTVTVTPGCHSV